MGDRICLTFVGDYEERSPVLYAHWDGEGLIEKAEAFWSEHGSRIRKEASNWMVNFLNWLRGGRVEDGGYYLYRDEDHSCSPDDCGFWEMDIRTGKVRQTQKGEFE
jgi:hypothetical protein